MPAVRDGELHEIKSPEILQPGPAALTDGLARLEAIVRTWVERRRDPTDDVSDVRIPTRAAPDRPVRRSPRASGC